MTTTLYTAFTPTVSVDVPDCPNIAIVNAVRLSAIEFFKRSYAWKGSLTDIAVEAGTARYGLTSPIDATSRVIKIHDVVFTVPAPSTIATLLSITVTPTLPSLGLGATQQFIATGTYSDGSVADVTQIVTWTSSTPATAVIATLGMLTALALGTSVITAAYGGISGNTTLTVSSIAIATSYATYPWSDTPGTFPLKPRTVAWLDAHMRDWRKSLGNHTEFYTQETPDTLTLAGIPTSNGSLHILASLVPTLASTGIDSWVAEQYFEAICCGAKARLMMVPERPWSSPSMGGFNLAAFNTAISDANVEAATGFQSTTPIRTTGYDK